MFKQDIISPITDYVLGVITLSFPLDLARNTLFSNLNPNHYPEPLTLIHNSHPITPNHSPKTLALDCNSVLVLLYYIY